MTRESAVLVPVPEAEPLVGRWRERYDPAAAVGVPAHITLLYPFVDPDTIDASVRDRLETLFSVVEPFGFTLGGPSSFGDQVLWLAPDPADPFVGMTEALADTFGLKPYGGAYDDITPHLTTVDRSSGARVETLDEARAALTGSLPITARADEAWLMVQHDDGLWRTQAAFPFGG